MCGIAGFWNGHCDIGPEKRVAVLSAMAGAVAHRGPDSAGVWQDEQAGLGLSHRRLAIMDLSDAGHQPMVSASGRYVVVYNGEIYNHPTLRAELDEPGKKTTWRGHSDTETLLAMIEAVGVEAALSKAHGMFALAVWDRTERSLILARDRMGEKPLYYGRCGTVLMFGSELKALKAHPSFEASVDRASVSAYLRFGYVPYPHTIFEGVKKLPPGHFIRFDNWCEPAEPQAWWSLQGVVVAGKADPIKCSFKGMVSRTEAILLEVVESQMVSDVPLGAFLSGGIDSSLVAALMCKAARGTVHSFSIGFDEGRFNEAAHARAVADHLGTEHVEFSVGTKDALALVDVLPKIYDEPFADSSQLPTMLLSSLARQYVSVALTGDGGDEIFGGYNRHVSGPSLWGWISRIPGPLRVAGASFASKLQSSMIGERAEWMNRLATRVGLPVTTIDRLGKLANAAGRSTDSKSFYAQIVSSISDPEEWMVEPAQMKSIIDQYDIPPALGSVAEQWMMLDTVSYLADDILVKVDRASMYSSLETRAPFLDARTVESAWRLPIEAKISNGCGKRILREVLWNHVPKSLVERPKQGFAIPLDDWLRGDLKEWANDLLSLESILKFGLLKPTSVSRLWKMHKAGKVNAGQQLWTILMLQAWLFENAG